MNPCTLGAQSVWSNREYHYRTAEPIPGETTRAIANLAVEQDLYISFGLSESSDGTMLYNWNGHMVISNPLGSLRATAQDKERYLVYELGFDTNKSWLKTTIRNVIVKAPLPFHVLRNWRRMREYR